MNRIEVIASRNYTVSIGSGILSDVGNVVHNVTKAEKVCIISDSNVWPLYGNSLALRLESASLQVCTYVIPAGEENKNAENYLTLLHYLSTNQITRTDCIIALGGGVVGDLAGFVAATYLRGISYIQIPTTLLAMVDSSVGGKTAIDLPAGKNLCGAFYQPAAVLCDTDTLKTLPDDVFRDGCAEVIKYGVLFDSALFSYLETTGLLFDRESVITKCVERKRDVVADDEFDANNRRMLLNLGHTFGHAIEQCSQYRISHGNAVSIGMSIVSRASNCPDHDRITSLLTQFGLPIDTNFSADALYGYTRMDKKRDGTQINLIVPKAIGKCFIQSIPIEQLKSFIEKGL